VTHPRYSPIAFLCFLLLVVPGAQAQPGRGPALVAVAEVQEGLLRQVNELSGNVFFKEVAEVATEVPGQVVEVLFEDGQRLAAGAPMVRLDDALLRAQVRTAQALVAQHETQLEQERVRLERAEVLLRDEVTTPQEFDDIRFTVLTLEHRLAAAQAEVESLNIEISKKTTRAPFDGVVVQRMTERGEWKSGGETVAVFARNDVFDVITNVREDDLHFFSVGDVMSMRVFGREVEGEVVTIIPRGDTGARTFPVKLRLENHDWLLEGMTALVRLPIAEEQQATLVPRDSVMRMGDEWVLFAVRDGAAVRIPVKVLGHTSDGRHTGVNGEGLQAGMQVVVRGQERLTPGQEVQILAG